MKVLIIVAHPDDEVLGMGGTIKKLTKNKNQVKIVIMATGVAARRSINFKNSKEPDGKLKIWIDGNIAYDYEGPTNWGKKKHKGKRRNKCYFKFGIYSNANLKADHKHEAEGMTVFTDYMAMAKTEEKLEELLLKDK